MPAKIVDLSARSSIIEAEPFGLHFWECTPKEFSQLLERSARIPGVHGYQAAKKLSH
jgi:hypothetical protein